jgi:hypothetical protein
VEGPQEVRPVGRVTMSRADLRRSVGPWFRGSFLGFPFGVLPAGGTEMPTMLSYYAERRLAGPEARAEFGATGAIEGVAGPEAANNAAAAGILVPMLTLGLPTSATAAIMLSAFQSYGISPGPLLFEQQAELVWTLIASLYVANVMLVALNLPLVGLWARILRIPRPLLYAGILVFATIGTYGISNSVTDLVLLYGLGLVAMAMRRFDFPTAPVVIGMILGPMAEQAMRQALTISQGRLDHLPDAPRLGGDPGLGGAGPGGAAALRGLRAPPSLTLQRRGCVAVEGFWMQWARLVAQPDMQLCASAPVQARTQLWLICSQRWMGLIAAVVCAAAKPGSRAPRRARGSKRIVAPDRFCNDAMMPPGRRGVGSRAHDLATIPPPTPPRPPHAASTPRAPAAAGRGGRAGSGRNTPAGAGRGAATPAPRGARTRRRCRGRWWQRSRSRRRRPS